MNVDLRHLRNFLAVAEARSFTAASKRLHLAQPTLTRSIRALEESLGVRLFDRTTRHIALTPKGSRLRESLMPIIRQLDSTLADIRGGQALRIGFAWGLPELLSTLAVRFGKENASEVELVRRDTAMAGLDTGDVDVALLRGEIQARGVRCVQLYEEERIAAVPTASPLARRPEVRWAELARWPLVVNVVSGTTFPWMWPDGTRPEVGAECRNFDEWLEKVAAGAGFGTAPASAARRYTHPGVRLVPLRDAPLVRTHLAFPVHGTHPLASHLADAAWHAFREVNTPAGKPG
ncbi:LysR family transcriptional regulator [Streptomyces sp. BHT-5-2]|uniref:LysR family transcriptional regulator n=1 Tax=unclassified Streptomyces TaxID=2593676 RepID=UPI001C8E4D06|nr:LysR family transcriptional regulator [Streptomyces sp. BHT-5-2]QZL03431.1 LysR family transcriptional regulator [Streptomyces sp. BHT-5-2]